MSIESLQWDEAIVTRMLRYNDPVWSLLEVEDSEARMS